MLLLELVAGVSRQLRREIDLGGATCMRSSRCNGKASPCRFENSADAALDWKRPIANELYVHKSKFL
jgi:hypothetical protein